jgi:hypothetical protein
MNELMNEMMYQFNGADNRKIFIIEAAKKFLNFIVPDR